MTKINAIIAIACFVFGFILSREFTCNKPTPTDKPVTNTITKYVHDSVKVSVPFDRIKTEKVYIDRPVILNHIDTVKAINDFFKTFVYHRNYKDTNLAVDWTDTVTQNSLKEPNLDYIILKATTINQTTNTTQVSKIRNSLWVGLGVLGSKTTFGVEPMLMFENKNGKAIGIGYNVIDKTIMVDAMLKIKL